MTHFYIKPGLRFVLIEHDAWCPGAQGYGSGCICNANTRIVTEDQFVAKVAHDVNRRQRREAARRARRGKA
jgi:hypothetical protein